MIKIKDKKRFFIFIIVVICFLLSGIYLAKIITALNQNSQETSESGDSHQEEAIESFEEDFDSTSEILEKAVEEDGDPEKIKMLAISQYNQKEYEEAEENFKKLLEKDADNKFVYYNNLANIYRDQGNFEEAINYYEKSIEANLQYETAYQNLAILYLYEINPRGAEKADEVIERGLENIPDSEVLKKIR